ncbi:RagB/SusD family nutrient uptake outer membrane protein [Gelidibacter salicanalis]|uniref:RagB/SusD family nutrient uptake outer membrane protein n=1 Tax=Gelidibacter salicanalis TaxID=291193 RepID=A0A934NII3_9FLAO|nr:RagB/SusD family nutrient uptake outer membrane protein [Gelidibacter salicanalis]MBJ7882151.1 RagB/SusD family nutrient uptake outer membrane protein [Gelidibacter salicanalis]
MKRNIKLLLGLFFSISLFVSCDLEELPENVDIVGPTSLADLEALLNAGYNNLGWPLGGNAQLYAEINGDNINGPGGLNSDETEIYNRSTSFFNNSIRDNMYRGFYRIVLDANVVLNQIENNLDAIGVTETNARIQEIKGEALLLRAIAHFEVSRFMSHSPGFSSDNSHLGIQYIKEINNAIGQTRGTVAENYADLLSDLKEAESLLNTTNSSDQNYGDKAAAQAYLAKVFFQAGFGPDIATEGSNYQMAYNYADAALMNTSAVFDVNLYQGGATGTERFAGNLLDNNNTESPNVETIFGIVSESIANSKGGTFQRYRTDTSISNTTIRIMQDLYNSIPSTDKRKDLLEEIDGEYFLLKFNKGIFNVPLVHYTEILLIRAEAAAETNSLLLAEDDINSILERAGLSTISGLSQSQLINLIREQRRIELLGEGNRVSDLKRIGIDENSLTIRNAPWNCNGILFQFPATEVFTGFIQNPTGGCN